MNDITVYLNFGIILMLVPVVQGLVELFKKGGIPSIVAPYLSLGFGIGGMFLLHNVIPFTDIGLLILSGVVTGLMASGLYTMTKSGVQDRAEDVKIIKVPVQGR